MTLVMTAAGATASAILINNINKRLLGVSVLLMLFIILAQASEKLELPPKYDGLLQDEVFSGTGDWRKSSVNEYEWRAHQERQSKEVKFGFDSDFEERNFRKNMGAYRDPKPAEPTSLIRMQF